MVGLEVLREEDRCHERWSHARWITVLSNRWTIETRWYDSANPGAPPFIHTRVYIEGLSLAPLWSWEYAPPISAEVLKAEHDRVVQRVLAGELP